MPSNPDPHPCPPPTPSVRPRHLSSTDAPTSSDNPPSSYLKSSVRSQNRPISSTTTATHSTITPLPSDSLRNRVYAARHAYAFHSHTTDTHTSIRDHDQYTDTCNYDSDDNNFPRSETPSSTKRKLLWHSFFPISLTRKSSSSISTPHHSTPSPERKVSTSISDPKINSSRKRSFRFSSRPTTPKSVDSSSSKLPNALPTPSSPLPLSASPRRRSFGLGNSQRSTPKSSTSHLPLPHVQSPQPGRTHGRRHSVGSERPPHDSAVALPEESSHRAGHKAAPDGGGRNKGKERENPVPDLERPLHDPSPSFHFPSQSLPVDPSRNHLSHLPRHPAFSHLPTVDSASSSENEHASRRLHMIPKIIHTPPTPQRPGGEIDSSSHPNNTPPRINSGKIEIPAKGKTVAIAHREQVLVSSSRSHPDAQHTTSSKGRFTPRFLTGKDMPKSKDRDAQKPSKRPSADAPTYKTPSSARNMTNHRGKLGSFDFERPVSALNRSSSTVDRQKMHVPPDSSPQSNARLHSLERTASEDSAQGARWRLVAYPGQVDSPMVSQLKPDHTGDTSVISFSSVSLQTKSTGQDVGSITPAGQSSSWGRASGRRILRTSHGTFAFEHPSSVPNSPDPRAFNLPNEPNQSDLPGHPQSQPSTPLMHGMFNARGKHSRGQSCNTTDQGSHSNPGERKTKGKGRSLDLGLGLAWAPSRLREEILMPGSILAREKATLEKANANGLDVTKMFQSLLPDSRFQTFKKCKDPCPFSPLHD